jgi:hypothetical protein
MADYTFHGADRTVADGNFGRVRGRKEAEFDGFAMAGAMMRCLFC